MSSAAEWRVLRPGAPGWITATRIAALVVVFGAAFAIRIARSYYFAGNDAIADWRKEVAAAATQNKPTLEPPIFEFAVASLYPLVGGEDLNIPRAFSAVFWRAPRPNELFFVVGPEGRAALVLST